MGSLQPVQLMFRPKHIRQEREYNLKYSKNLEYRNELSRLMGTQKIHTQYGKNRIDYLTRKIRLTN